MVVWALRSWLRSVDVRRGPVRLARRRGAEFERRRVVFILLWKGLYCFVRGEGDLLMLFGRNALLVAAQSVFGRYSIVWCLFGISRCCLMLFHKL